MNDSGGEVNESWIRMLYIFCASENLPSLNACDGMSSIAFYFPDVLIGVWGDTFIYCCRSASKQSSLAAGIDVKALPLYFCVTADVFLLKLTIFLNLKLSTTYSITSHCITNTANSKILIVNLPFGFV